MRMFPLLAILILSVATTARAAVVDVNSLYMTGSGSSNGLNGASFQTFVAGTSGLLTRLDLQLYASGALPTGNSGARVMILSTTAGLPDVGYDKTAGELLAAPLGEVLLPSRADGLNVNDVQSGGFVSLDFAAQNVTLLAGVLYAILMEQTDNTFGTLFWGHQTGGYADGQGGGIQYGASTPAPGTGNVDYGFRNWMEPAAVPLPAGGVLLLSGLAVLAFTRRRAR